jgi:hypothetical protein
MRWIVVAACCLLGACSPKPAKTESAAPPAEATKKAPPATDAWLGKWIGVEGNYLQIDAGDAPGVYAITEGTLDGVLHYMGEAAGGAIAFTNAGKVEKITAVTGQDTGLKYLADKQNCLVIESGRGFCR